MGGDIIVESNINEGATFILSLPLVRVAKTDVIEPKELDIPVDGCLLGSNSEKSEKEGNSRKKREIDGKAVKTGSRAAEKSLLLHMSAAWSLAVI